jgi:5-methylcytosine-specific restriction enzyme A
MSEDCASTPRKALTPRQRLALFEAHGGRCYLCQQPIRIGDPWRDEHLRALGLGGTNDLDNRAPVHTACADAKTHGKDGDLAQIAKAKRRKMKMLGIKRTTRPLPGSRASGLRKRMDGTVERWGDLAMEERSDHDRD